MKCTRHSHCHVKCSHWQYKFPLPVKVVATTRRLEMPLPEVCTAIEEKKKKLPEVIEFGDSFKVPINTDPDDTTTKRDADQSERTFTFTTEDMQKKKNDVKARTTLLLSLPDEHQLRFSKYKTAKELWATILKTFGVQTSGSGISNLLAVATTFTGSGNLYCQWEHLTWQWECLVHFIPNTRRIQQYLQHEQYALWEVIEFGDSYKVPTNTDPDVTTTKRDADQSGRTDMAFISSSKNNSNEDSNTIYVTTASTAFPTGSVNVATISQDTTSAYISSQSNGSQIKFEDINQIDEDDIEEIDIKWNMALLSMRADKFWKRTRKKISIQGSDVAGFDKSKVECFNCHKMGHFARECRAPRSQEKGRKESYRQGSKVEENSSKALMAIDGVGWDWSYMENEEDHALVANGEAPIEFTLMANIENK
nr:hypothetical protein [Tanacetum cinerariifolium]